MPKKKDNPFEIPVPEKNPDVKPVKIPEEDPEAIPDEEPAEKPPNEIPLPKRE
jgi:hypothetical protein